MTSGVVVVLFNLLLLGVAVLVLYTESAELVPALKSYWLWIHVSAAIIASCGLHRRVAGVGALPVLRAVRTPR